MHLKINSDIDHQMKRWLLFITCCVTMTLLHAQSADIRLLRQINLERNTRFDPAFIAITNSATPLALSIPMGFVLKACIRRDSASVQQAIHIAGSQIVAAVLATAIKYSVNRTRPWVAYPDIQKLSGGGGPSFPSGHTTSAFVLATSMSTAFPKWYVIVPSFTWAGAVGYSRMDLGCHYPSDVLAGALLGAGSVWINMKLNRWLLGSVRNY